MGMNKNESEYVLIPCDKTTRAEITRLCQKHGKTVAGMLRSSIAYQAWLDDLEKDNRRLLICDPDGTLHEIIRKY